MAEQASNGDRRGLHRFNLRLHAVLQEFRDRAEAMELYTRDISSDGAFLLSDSPLPLDSTVKLTLFLPPGQEKKSKIRVDGKVVRAEHEGFAVRFESKYSLSPA